MNDSRRPDNRAEMEALVLEGIEIFKTVEEGLEAMQPLFERGLALGMVDKPEHDQLHYRVQSILAQVCELHARGVAIERRNGVEVSVIASGPGR